MPDKNNFFSILIIGWIIMINPVGFYIFRKIQNFTFLKTHFYQCIESRNEYSDICRKDSNHNRLQFLCFYLIFHIFLQLFKILRIIGHSISTEPFTAKQRDLRKESGYFGCFFTILAAKMSGAIT
jgi:hypothetical protein